MMSGKVVFLGRGMAAVLACVAVCHRVRALSGSPRARNYRAVSPDSGSSSMLPDWSRGRVGKASEPASKAIRS